jgi:hypothetical protein
MAPKNISFCQILGIFCWPIHRQVYSYLARPSEIMVPNNSPGTSTKITAHLARWYVLPNTYQYKMVAKNISFCQILGIIFWPIHGQLYSYIKGSSSERTDQTNISSTPTKIKTMLTSWYLLPHTYYYRMLSTHYVYWPNISPVLANTWAIVELHIDRSLEK